MKFSVKTILLFVLIFGFVSCSTKDDSTNGKAEIVSAQFVASTIPALNDLIAEFEKTHPGITIKATYVRTGDGLNQKLMTAIQSRTAPDISWLHSDFIEDLVEADAIHKTDDFINSWMEFQREIQTIFIPHYCNSRPGRNTLQPADGSYVTSHYYTIKICSGPPALIPKNLLLHGANSQNMRK